MNQSNLDPFFSQPTNPNNNTNNNHTNNNNIINNNDLIESERNKNSSIIVIDQEPIHSTFTPSQENLFNEHARHFQLIGTAAQQARRVCQTIGDDNRFYALVCYMTWLHQNPCTQPAVQIPAHPTASAASTWVPSVKLREHTRFTAQMTIIRPDLEAYTATKDSEDRVLQKSFQNLVIKHFTDQSEAFRVANLPPGFPSTSSPEPATKLFNFIREIIKHNRDSFRKQLLRNILPEDGDYPKKPIPTLEELIVQLLTTASSPGHLPVPSEILSKIDESQRMRFAYLRLEAIRFYAGPSPKNKRISQWSMIDGQLEHLRRQEPIYQQAFFGLMLDKDRSLFGSGQSYFRDLENSIDWNLPSENEIRSRAKLLAQSF